ncbi:hypothetical protein C1645_839977 [Glomus cerebriforme]|uniref:Uncharacterized protein n=1 Tax=Glomus cerebriforme TaxID=658196 RepID=A0A397S2P7_9GLOM|nr:hypothetical protein C1645_839977 [Glomus cerebriforme]
MIGIVNGKFLYRLRCSSPILDDLYNENVFYRVNRILKLENISFKNVNYLSRKDFDDGTECVESLKM